MSASASPQMPIYRVTLFYGPEFMDDDARTVQCVFNVKKRSWKAGVQITVRLLESQVVQLREALGFESWIETVLQGLPLEACDDYRQRAHDVLIQQLCHLKLDLAMEQGIRQEHGTVESRQFLEALNTEVRLHEQSIKHRIRAELDLESLRDPWSEMEGDRAPES